MAPHAGPTNHRLRLHLPLLLPGEDGGGNGGACRLGITVGGEWRAWEAGRCLVMDDSFEHAVDLRAGARTGARGARGRDRRPNASRAPVAAAAAPDTVSAANAAARREVEPRVLLVCDAWHPDAWRLCPPEARTVK